MRNFRPSSWEIELAKHPVEVQKLVLKEIKKDMERRKAGIYTEEEKKWHKLARDIGTSGQRVIEKECMDFVKRSPGFSI